MPQGNDRPSRGEKRTVSRRQLLLGGAAGAGSAIAAGAAVDRIANADASSSKPSYHLQQMTNAEAALFGALADRVFPRDDTPGATDLGFVEYLDRQLAGSWGAGAGMYRHGPFHEPQGSGMGYQLPLVPRDLYKRVAAHIDAHAQRTAGGTFASLSAPDQDKIMEALEAGKVDVGFGTDPNGYSSASFFSDLLDRVKEALFADPMYGGNRNMDGWKWVGFPGDPMGYGDLYWSIFPQQDDPYQVPPKSLAQAGMGTMW